MSLTVGTGPFGPHNSGAFNFDMRALKEHTLYLQGSHRTGSSPPIKPQAKSYYW